MRTLTPQAQQEQIIQQLQSATITDFKAELCRRSFFYFVKEFWNIIVQDPFELNWHIEYLCNELQEVAERVILRKPRLYDLIINIPPGTTKSTVCTRMFPAWVWIAKIKIKIRVNNSNSKSTQKNNRPDYILKSGTNSRFITASYSAPLSLEHAEDSRDLIKSDKYQKYFPEVRIKRDRDIKSNYKNTKGGSRFSTSVGGTVTGMHGHFLIVDDPLDPNKAISEAERNTANNWMSKTLSTRKVNKKITVTILIMQRVHELDPSGHLLQTRKEEGDIKHICLPGTTEYSIKPSELESNYVDGLLDPNRLGKKELRKMRTELGSYGYAGQVGQDPKPREGAMFQRQWFEVVDAAPAKGEIVRGWDLAATSEAEALMKNLSPAYTAGVKMKYKNGVFYVMHMTRGRWNSMKVRETMKNTASQDGGVVTIDFPQDPGQSGKSQAQDISKFLVGYKVKFSPESGDKVVRADPFAAQCEAGNVKIVRGDWNETFFDEVCSFPNSEFKDIVDACSRAFKYLHINVKKKVGVW